MLKWLRDVLLIPMLMAFLFMLYGAWYTGVKWHSPLSLYWLRAVFGAPVPLWFVFLLVVVAGYSSWKAYTLRISNQSPAPKTTEPPVPALPKSVDLQGVILELFFHKENDVLGMPSHTYILMKVQVVNHGPVEATITRVGLQMTIGDMRQACDLMNEIPDTWRIKRRDDRYLNPVYIDTSIDPCLGAKSSEETYRTAIPRIGWIAFELYALENIEFPNAEFSLILVDSLGREHRIRRMPQLYVKKGDIVAIPVQSVNKET